MKPLPPCLEAVNQSIVADNWDRQNVRWTRATVWAAQYAARVSEPHEHPADGLQRCAACAAVNSPACKSVYSRCKTI
ncbi:hypothetical protein WJX79_003313 [Trebouxia sp. C0005]